MKRAVLLGTIAALLVAGGLHAAGGLSSLYQLMFKQGGTSAVSRTARSKIADYISVKDFGATGDGVTNDTAGVTAAITYAGDFVNVYFPCPGTYQTTTWGTIPCGYETLVASTGAVPRPLGTKIAEWLSAKDFGAVGNGITDDTTAIGNLLNAAASTQLLNLPCPGTYISSTYGTLTCGVYYPPMAASGATLRSVASKIIDVVSVKDFGAVGDGVTNDRAAIAAAVAAMSALGGGTVTFANGTYLMGSSFTIPDNVWLVGTGMKSSVLKRGFTGDFITSMGAAAGIDRMGIDGQTATYGAGIGIHITTGGAQRILNSEVKNFVSPCLQIEHDNGSQFVTVGSIFYTTGTLGTVGAITINGTDSAAYPRHFYGTESSGCTLFDFGGAADQFVYGGYSNGLIFGANSSHVLLSGMRIGAAGGAVTINGGAHKIEGCAFASSSVTITGVSVYFNSEVTGNNIIDNGTNNSITILNSAYTPAWTSTGTAPALGNGTLTGMYTRNGQQVHVILNLAFGTTTTPGTGIWRFSLPKPDYASYVQATGSGYTAASGAGQDYLFIPQVTPGAQYVQLYAVDIAGTLVNLLGTSKAWANTTTLRFSLDYVVP